MGSCIFCKIARKEMPAAMVAENEKAVAFMDIMPARKGHVLVMPKAHAETLLDAAPQDIAAAMGMVQQVSRALQEALKPAGFSLVQLNGAASGQTVFHVHFHIIPRKPGDGLALKWSHETYAGQEMEQYRAKIAQAMRSQAGA